MQVIKVYCAAALLEQEWLPVAETMQVLAEIALFWFFFQLAILRSGSILIRDDYGTF